MGMLLALDVGNSAVKGGVFDGDTLVRVFSMSVGADRGNDQSVGETWGDVLMQHLPEGSIDRVGMASVVPERAEAVTAALTERTRAAITPIRPGMPLPFELAYETPDTLGTDRLAAAVAGWELFGKAATPSRSVLVVDAGTAVTCEVVHRDGVYCGGTITAGPALVRRALETGTAQLPRVPFTLPDEPVGRSTETALQSGIMWSFIDSVRGMSDRLTGTLPDAPHVVLTGGWGALLANHLEHVDDHHPHLVLEGIRMLVDGCEEGEASGSC